MNLSITKRGHFFYFIRQIDIVFIQPQLDMEFAFPIFFPIFMVAVYLLEQSHQLAWIQELAFDYLGGFGRHFVVES